MNLWNIKVVLGWAHRLAWSNLNSYCFETFIIRIRFRQDSITDTTLVTCATSTFWRMFSSQIIRLLVILIFSDFCVFFVSVFAVYILIRAWWSYWFKAIFLIQTKFDNEIWKIDNKYALSYTSYNCNKRTLTDDVLIVKRIVQKNCYNKFIVVLLRRGLIKGCSHLPIFSNTINFWWMFYSLLTSNV